MDGKIVLPSDKIYEFILKEGLGTKTKKDIELYLLHLLSEDITFSNLSNYQKSNYLKITESKLKTLLNESDIRFGNNEGDLNDKIKHILRYIFDNKNGKPKMAEFNETNIKFIIENPKIKRDFEYVLKEIGVFYDTSFNREIVNLKLENFFKLVKKFDPGYEAEMSKLLKEEFKKEKQQLEKAKLDAMTFPQIVNHYIKEYQPTIEVATSIFSKLIRGLF